MSEDQVWMRHPSLPDNDPVQVYRSQIFQLGSQGWVEAGTTPEPEPEPEPPKDETGGDKPAVERPTPRASQRKKSED